MCLFAFILHVCLQMLMRPVRRCILKYYHLYCLNYFYINLKLGCAASYKCGYLQVRVMGVTKGLYNWLQKLPVLGRVRGLFLL